MIADKFKYPTRPSSFSLDAETRPTTVLFLAILPPMLCCNLLLRYTQVQQIQQRCWSLLFLPEPIPVLVSEVFIIYIQERSEGEMLCGDKSGCQMLENLHSTGMQRSEVNTELRPDSLHAVIILQRLLISFEHQVLATP